MQFLGGGLIFSKKIFIGLFLINAIQKSSFKIILFVIQKIAELNFSLFNFIF